MHASGPFFGVLLDRGTFVLPLYNPADPPPTTPPTETAAAGGGLVRRWHGHGVFTAKNQIHSPLDRWGYKKVMLWFSWDSIRLDARERMELPNTYTCWTT